MACVAVWIDHRRAVLVRLVDGGARVSLFESGAESHHRPSGGDGCASPWSGQGLVSERKTENRRRQQLARYCRVLVRQLRDAEGVLLLGPGRAKHALAKKMARVRGLAERIVGIEPAGRMSERQLVARARQTFAPPDDPIVMAALIGLRGGGRTGHHRRAR